MRKKIDKPFSMVTIAIFVFIATLHFIRLSLGWDVVVADWKVPTLVSGFVIVVSVFMVYWTWIILNYDENESDKKEVKDELEEGFNQDN